MIELPLFPLNTVLFPGMPLPLHIFEERYQEMIRLCLVEKRPFGVVLIREGQAEHGPLAEPYAIGCTADIIQVQKLDNDRLFIMTVGQDRFRIQSLDRERPYLVGQVELLPLAQEPAESLQIAAARLYPLVLEYLKILAEVGKVEFDPEQISQDPDELGFLAASFIQLPIEEKQDLLEAETAMELFQNLQSLYQEEVAIMRTMPRVDDVGLFSMN
ncbi:MAG: LON peptidase substrate-binding domain-containing protein [Ardenticatenaceae bacterium]|nr:LON peptidase substrate-binding domain-containing protein [Ardenticatenaceae bacterium]